METLTDLLELAGLLLLIVGLIVFLWPLSPALALAAAGLCLMALSWLLVRRQKGGRTR